MENYLERDFQKEVKNIFISKGWNNIQINQGFCVNKAFFEQSLFQYLTNKYKIDHNEIEEVFRVINDKLSNDWFKNNKAGFLDILKNGVSTEFTRKNKKRPYEVIDFLKNQNNIYEIADEVWIAEKSRMDIVLFVNGLPIFTFELKSVLDDEKTLKNAFNQIKGYLETDNPKFATFNIAQIVAKNFNKAKIGSICTKSLDGWYNLFRKEHPSSFFDMFKKSRILDYLRWGVLFSKGHKAQKFKRILRHHQYEAVLNMQEAILNRKSGYVWHTQGSGKTITISALISSLKFKNDLSSITTIIDVDRIDLVSNMFNTLKSLDDEHFDRETIKRATSREDLKNYLSQRKYRGIIVSTTQKFGNWKEVSNRKDLIIISDEAHRTHGDTYKVNLKNLSVDLIKSYLEKISIAIPNALKYGFTGTPLFGDGRSTYGAFGELLHQYTMKQAEIDEVIVPIQIQFVLAPLKIKEGKEKSLLETKKIIEKSDVVDRAKYRLQFVADQIKEKFISERAKHRAFNEDTFKAMVVTNSKQHGHEMYELLRDKIFYNNNDGICFIADDKDRKNSNVHKYLKKNSKKKRMWISSFKEPHSKIEMIVVVDMLLTGYNVPNLRLMFFDKEIQKHNLLQAISRVNRKFEKKQIGTIFSFRDIKKRLQETLRVYRETTNDHSNLIRTSTNAEKSIAKLVQKILRAYGLNMLEINFKNILNESNLIKNKFAEKKEFMELINDINNLSTLVIKWNDKRFQKIVLLCKLLIKSNQMSSPSFIDITESEFHNLLNSIEVNKKLIRETRFITLDELFLLNIDKKEVILEIIRKKIINTIKRESSFHPEERRTLLQQLQKIIDEYNHKNIEIIKRKLNDLYKIISKNSDLSEYTKLVIYGAKKIINRELESNTLKEINQAFLKDDEKWRLNPARKKTIKYKIWKIISKNELNMKSKQILEIISQAFDEIENRGIYGH